MPNDPKEFLNELVKMLNGTMKILNDTKELLKIYETLYYFPSLFPIIYYTTFYFQVTHRNSVETRKAGSTFSNFIQTNDFNTALTKANGTNMIQVDASPLKFAIYR